MKNRVEESELEEWKEIKEAWEESSWLELETA